MVSPPKVAYRCDPFRDRYRLFGVRLGRNAAHANTAERNVIPLFMLFLVLNVLSVFQLRQVLRQVTNPLGEVEYGGSSLRSIIDINTALEKPKIAS